MIDAAAVKSATDIVEIIREDEPLKVARGDRRFEGANHHSLTVYPGDQYYAWFSRGERGDVFDWLRLHRGMDFGEALVYLARRANLELDWSPEQEAQFHTRRQAEEAYTLAARHWSARLRADPAAMAYCAGRGWDQAAVLASGLGYHDGDRASLEVALQAGGADLSTGAARSVLGCPAGMLIYPHVERGRVVYWSARSIEGKRHYNPPRDLVGERLAYYNVAYRQDARLLVIVEGQADAVTLALWDIPAVALAGCALSGHLAERLGRHKRIVIALDDDEEGHRAAAEIAEALGPLTQIARWPEKDANAWLQQGGTAAAAVALLRGAPTWLELLAQGIGLADDREEALRRLFAQVAQLSDFQLSARRDALARTAGLGLREFDRMLKTVQVEQAELVVDSEDQVIERYVPGGIIRTESGDVLFEMMIRDEQSLFAVRWQDGRVETVRSLRMNGTLYLPYEAHMPLIEKEVVLLPSDIGTYESTHELVEEITGFIHAFLDVSKFYEKIAAYYVLLSWLYDCFTVLPYLRALGDYGTGKTRFLETLGSICYRPIKTSGASTFSPVFRIIEMFHGTLILDEMDMTMSDTEADFMKLLNSGVARGTPLLRTEKVGEQWVVEAYETFCPKVLATRKRFQDRALESRMLTYEMGGGCRPNIPLVLPSMFYESAQYLRNKLLAYRLRNWQRMEVDYSRVDRTVEPRLAQVTLALKTIVDDDSLREDIDQFIREYNRQSLVERGMTLAAIILEAIIELHDEPSGMQLDGSGSYDLSMKRIAKSVNEKMDHENYPDDEDAKGRPKLTPRKVGEEVRKLGLRTQRRPDKSRVFEVIWDDERIDALKVRYGID
jgi:DNA primase